MNKQQPEALRLAKMLTANEWPGHVTLVSYAQECVAELLRQHAENETMRAGDKLETTWAAAMVSPEAVPSYVEACRQDYINKLDAKDEEIRLLSAKIVDQQKHIS